MSEMTQAGAKAQQWEREILDLDVGVEEQAVICVMGIKNKRYLEEN